MGLDWWKGKGGREFGRREPDVEDLLGLNPAGCGILFGKSDELFG